ncbi:Receptor-like protein kinase HSL1 [Linum perenne]
MEGLCPEKEESKKKRNLWILRSILIAAVLVFVLGVTWFILKFRSLKKGKTGGLVISKWRSFHKLGFSESEILDYLKEDNVIGSGASGKVYKVVLSNGETVAVKKLYGASNGERDEFEAEVDTLGNIRHKNIVKLWCCCNTVDCKLLVYEYMPNGRKGRGRFLDWPTRFKIAMDAAEGLSYLHHDTVPPIVHRDVKSNNILLDGEFGARVADFGVAKIVHGVNKGTQSMSVIAGSYGYIAPEYAYTLRVNEKSDIYSFGVVILELVTGRLPVDPEFGEKDLVKWVYSVLDQKSVDQVIDQKLDSSFRDEICRVLDVGLRCTSSLPISRPSMRRVVKMLQEAGKEMKLKSGKKAAGKLSPYFQEESSDDMMI